MTAAQAHLKNYFYAKLQEGTIGDFSAPKEMAGKIVLEVLSDAEAAFGDFVANPFKQALFNTLGSVARDMSKRGVIPVLRDLKEKIANTKEKLDIQYQRGVERQRRARK